MTGIELLIKFRFTIAVVCIVVLSVLSVAVVKSLRADIKDLNTKVATAEARATAANLVLNSRTERAQAQEVENAKLRQEIRDILRKNPDAASWGNTAIPASIIGLLQPQTNP